MKFFTCIFLIMFSSTVYSWTAIEKTNNKLEHPGFCYSELEGPLALHETKQLKETCGTIFCTGNRDMIYTGCTKQVVNCGRDVPKREYEEVRQELDQPERKSFPECCVVECAEDSDYSLTNV